MLLWLCTTERKGTLGMQERVRAAHALAAWRREGGVVESGAYQVHAADLCFTEEDSWQLKQSVEPERAAKVKAQLDLSARRVWGG